MNRPRVFIFIGVSDSKFAPNTPLTRAMFVTALHRVEGSGRKAASGGSARFTDITEGVWYYEAVLWAAANGIVLGYGDGRFGPNELITREQMCSMLVRYIFLRR